MSMHSFVGYKRPRLRRTRPGVRLSLASMAAALLLLSGCGQSKNPETSTESVTKPAGNLLSVPADQLQHLQLISVQPVSLTRVLRLTGTVAYNNFRTTPVISQVSGPVLQILVSPGEKVQKGQPLLYASSPEYSQFRAAYLKARDVFRVADKNYARAKDLYEHHAISEKDLYDAESARNQAQADLQAGVQSLEILGISHPESVETAISAKIPLLAPISGEVVERLVAPGQLVQAGNTQCFTISDLSNVWVLVNVYEHDLAAVHAGDPVEIRTESYPTVFRGKISFLGAALDPTSRTLQARIVTDNPGEKLKKDMYVTATVQAGKLDHVLAVPDAALLRDAQNEPYVYIAAGQNQFARRPVTIGQSQNSVTEIKSGLNPGDKIVANGALFLQFASSLQE
jgi:cobalt-zinc-cadmium efflux system membrane fusion protein